MQPSIFDLLNDGSILRQPVLADTINQQVGTVAIQYSGEITPPFERLRGAASLFRTDS